MVRTLAAAVAALAILTAVGAAHAAPSVKAKKQLRPASAVPLPKPRPNIVVAATPRLCLARVIYTEARNQPLIGQLLVGYTLKRRAELDRADFGGTTYCGVAHAKTRLGRMQYSGVTPNKAFVPEDKEAWRNSLAVADRVIQGYRPLYEWSEATYYLKPGTATNTNRCWFERRLVELGWFEDHLFFREPRDEMEALVLRVSERSPDCAEAKTFPLPKKTEDKVARH